MGRGTAELFHVADELRQLSAHDGVPTRLQKGFHKARFAYRQLGKQLGCLFEAGRARFESDASGFAKVLGHDAQTLKCLRKFR